MRCLLALLLATVALGLLSRLYPIGQPLFDKSLGDALYAVAAYVVLALTFPRLRPRTIAVLTLAGCLAVETFQATGIPARYADLAVVRWLIGTEFAWHDVACYVVGVTAIVTIDVLLLRRGRAVCPHRAIPQGDAGDG